jgi:peptidoglycan DL-endopeptidase LytE
MNFLKIIFLFLFFTSNVFSQEKKIKHIVAKGESIYQISKQYNVKPNDIYKLNPKAKKVLKLNTVLLIPSFGNLSNNNQISIITKDITHEVLPKETLYGISKQYNISIDDIKKSNPIIEKEGLEIGLKLVIARKEAKPEIAILTEPSKPVEASNQQEVIHEVLPKETKYGIAKRYGITIQELEKLNPEIALGLPIGYKLTIKKGDTADNSVIVPKEEPVLEKPKDSIAEIKPVVRNAELLDNLVITASENIGVRYKTGGTSKSGFDCSGLMITIFGANNVTLPRTSAAQSNFGIGVSPLEAQKGDLIFFSTNGRGNINHVGMITDIVDDEIKFIHASVHGGVMISSNKESYYSKRFVKINRVLE